MQKYAVTGKYRICTLQIYLFSIRIISNCRHRRISENSRSYTVYEKNLKEICICKNVWCSLYQKEKDNFNSLEFFPEEGADLTLHNKSCFSLLLFLDHSIMTVFSLQLWSVIFKHEFKVTS